MLSANRLVATYTTNSLGSTFLSQTSGKTYDAAGRVLASFESFTPSNGRFTSSERDDYRYTFNGHQQRQAASPIADLG